jgi:hypothetical protein
MSLKDKEGMNDLMHVSLKQIQMLMTFDKYKLLLLYDNNHYIYIYIYILKYIVKEINLFFSNVYRCSTISIRENVGRVNVHPPLRHGQARPLTCL